MPLYTTSGIVLRRISFSETDRIVTLYTRERGKLSAIAKGARKPISRLSGATETLAYGRFQLAEGKNLDVITQVEVKESFPVIRSDIKRIAYASYVVELIDKFVDEREANSSIFDLLLSTLYLLERPNEPEKIIRSFELKFMKLAGYQPALDRCARCGQIYKGVNCQFSPSMGGIVCENCGPLPEDAIEISWEAAKAMQALIFANPPELERMEISSFLMDQIGRVMRWYIRYRLDGELKSLEFIQNLKVTGLEQGVPQ
jgi:DNA repair protein RecO (recombination protein O)